MLFVGVIVGADVLLEVKKDVEGLLSATDRKDRAPGSITGPIRASRGNIDATGRVRPKLVPPKRCQRCVKVPKQKIHNTTGSMIQWSYAIKIYRVECRMRV